jgi:FdhD protein
MSDDQSGCTSGANSAPAREDLPNSLIRHFSVKRIRISESECITDTVAVEEPLQIRIRYWFKETQIAEAFAVTMRTPGHDRELAAGLLFSEGILRGREELTDLRTLGGASPNEILAELAPGVDVEGWRVTRNGIMNSSCGICGKRSREALSQQVPALPRNEFTISRKLIEDLPALLRSKQTGFSQTGGLHAAALVDQYGNVIAAFEDVGRHNALDKLIGFCVLTGQTPLRHQVIFMSSRSSFELIQKAAMAGAPVLATVGGPSSLAIETAREHGMTLIGFVRQGRFNIYSGEWRIHSK